MSTTEQELRSTDVYKRYCPDCEHVQPLLVEDEEDASYHNNTTSVVRCKRCELQLGHLNWWPVHE